MTEVRECGKCGITKPVKGFHNRTCGSCRRDIYRQNRGLEPIDPENKGIHLIGYPLRKRNDSWSGKRKSPEEIILDREKGLKNKRIPRLRLSREEIKELRNKILIDQGGGCAICERKPYENETFCLDHEHETEIIRGVLCKECNVALGILKEDVKRIDSMALYIRARARSDQKLD